MSGFIQTNTIKDRLCCPKCEEIFYVFRHALNPKRVACPCCCWDGGFHYPDEEGS